MNDEAFFVRCEDRQFNLEEVLSLTKAVLDALSNTSLGANEWYGEGTSAEDAMTRIKYSQEVSQVSPEDVRVVIGTNAWGLNFWTIAGDGSTTAVDCRFRSPNEAAVTPRTPSNFILRVARSSLAQLGWSEQDVVRLFADSVDPISVEVVRNEIPLKIDVIYTRA